MVAWAALAGAVVWIDVGVVVLMSDGAVYGIIKGQTPSSRRHAASMAVPESAPKLMSLRPSGRPRLNGALGSNWLMFKSYHVYRYRPDKRPRDVNTMTAKQLYSARIETLNDPFEFAALSTLSAHPDKLAEFQNAGVTCFCRSLTNPLLWSHYAAGHRGFAVGYDAADPFFGGDKGIRDRFLHDVRYEDIAPSLDRFGLRELPMAAAITKPTCWAYEQEVRMIKQVGGQLFRVPVDTIKEVVFGAQMGDDRVEEIIARVKAAGIVAEFAKMDYVSDGYGVKPKWFRP